MIEYEGRYGRGFTLWFTGLFGAGKTTISEIVERQLRERFGKVEVPDGDIVRTTSLRAWALVGRTGTPASLESALSPTCSAATGG
jgi:ABC-type ATPase involved in cell division